MQRLFQYSAPALVAITCLGAGYLAGRNGLAAFRADDAVRSGSLDMAESSVRLAPSDANSHFARAAVLAASGEPETALRELESAVALRPRDYTLWLVLGTVRERLGDESGALNAFQEAVRLAPYYAQPHWHLGNTLLRSGQEEAAFKELRSAALSGPSLLPSIIDMAWGASGGDTKFVEQVIRPQSASWHLALARFLLTHGKSAEGLAQLQAAGALTDTDRNALLQQLLSAGQYKEAYEVWLIGPGKEAKASAPMGTLMVDGGFELLKYLNQPGFQWQTASDLNGLTVALETSDPHAGARSLRISYQGNSHPNAAAISQLVIVEPNVNYRLTFAVKTKDLVSGGPPVIAINEVKSTGATGLAQSAPFPRNTNGWQGYSVEFATGSDVQAIEISVRRQSCAEEQCPIFGTAWVDDFLLEKAPIVP